MWIYLPYKPTWLQAKLTCNASIHADVRSSVDHYIGDDFHGSIGRKMDAHGRVDGIIIIY